MSSLTSDDPNRSSAEEPDASVDERRLIRSTKEGDHDAFARLVEHHQRRLFGLMVMMLRDPDVAEEVTQDAFVRAYTRLGLFDQNRAFYPWLATIAVRLAQNRLCRDARIRGREGTPLEEAPEPAISGGPLDQLVEQEQSDRLWRSVARLSSGERTAVFLYYRNELSIAEVARALGVTSGTVKTLLFRARRKLRERHTSVPTRTHRAEIDS